MEGILLFLVLVCAICVGYYFRTKKNYSWGDTIGVGFFALIVLYLLYFLFYPTSKKPQVETYIKEREEFIINSDSIIDLMKTDFTFTKDEFDDNGRTWVEPKSKPQFRNRNGYYCYFQLNKDNQPSNFRFVIQYAAYDWLFLNDFIFNIDGENIHFYHPDKMKRDNDGGEIWEWCDCEISYDSHLIEKIAQGKVVKVKLIGSDYSVVQTLSDKEIESIRKTYTYYKELGGRFSISNID